MIKLHQIFNNYRPQRSCGKAMVSQACVKYSVHGGGSASVHAGIHPPQSDPGAGCLPQCMLGYTPPPSQTPGSGCLLQCMLGYTPGKTSPWAEPPPPTADIPRRSLQRTVRILLGAFTFLTVCTLLSFYHLCFKIFDRNTLTKHHVVHHNCRTDPLH